jgi:hypothetical protein
MNIQINGDAEKLIQAGLASGEFDSVEEAVAVMAKCWAERKEIAESNRLFPAFPKSTDIAELAVQQGVPPFDPATRPPEIWPPDESVDDFVAFIRDVRQDKSAAGDFDE